MAFFNIEGEETKDVEANTVMESNSDKMCLPNFVKKVLSPGNSKLEEQGQVGDKASNNGSQNLRLVV